MTLLPVHRRRALLGGATLAAALAALWILGRQAHADEAPKAKASPAVLVTSVKVQVQDVPTYLTGIGTVAAARTVTVKARVDGQLDSVGFTEGQDVQQGQLLAQIDPRTFQAQLAQVRAQKARDEALLGNARADLQRYTTLIAQDAATQQQLDTQKALVAQLEAAVQTDDAQISYAQVQLGFTRISAPISGRVGARLIDPGNIVHAADATGLVVINQVDPIAVVFTLPEDAFQAVNRALRASKEPLEVRAYPRNGSEVLGTGKLILLNNQIDTTTGMVQLKGLFPNPQHTLWPGQFVNVRLILGQRSQALTVPAAAVQRGQDGTYVYVVKEGDVAQSLPVKVARIQDGIAIIDNGLAAGDRVVVSGQYKVKAGSTVIESQPGKVAAGASAPVAASR